jgi:hypothetical protein
MFFKGRESVEKVVEVKEEGWELRILWNILAWEMIMIDRRINIRNRFLVTFPRSGVCCCGVLPDYYPVTHP